MRFNVVAMTTYLLVPGACHGGWWFEPLATALREHGHRAYSITLTGLGDDDDPAGANLDTHIDDVLTVLREERLEEVVLVGHSYSGMVLSGVADRLPERVSALFYIDAFVPADGESAWDQVNEWLRGWYIDGSASTGHSLEPLPFFDSRTRAHPLASLLQRIRLTGALDQVPRKEFVYLSAFEQTPFAAQFERLRRDPAWTVHEWPVGHNVMDEAGDDLLTLLLTAG